MSELKSMESSGKTIDEAIFKGLTSLGLSIDEVEIKTVQQGTKGVFGIGAKPYIVLLTQKAEADFMAMVNEAEKPRPERAEKPRMDRPRETPREAAPAAAPHRNSNGSVGPLKASLMDRKPDVLMHTAASLPPKPVSVDGERIETQPYEKSPAPRRNDRRRDRTGNRAERLERPEEDVPAAPAYDYTPYEPGSNACEGAEFLYGLLQRMNANAKVSYCVLEDCIRFKLDCPSMGMLIGYRGETLDALQYVTSLVINKGREKYVRVTLDTENYRNKREETLNRLARKIASQVKSTGREVTLEPMNPYERRVLHSTLQNNRFVCTYSVGDEPNRRVVVAPKRDAK